MMHWIDPDCLPETQGAVEGFIMNRHGEIDGVLLGGARQTSLLVCTSPHMAAEIEAAVKIGETIGVRGIRPHRATLRPLQSQQATAKRSSTTVPVSLERCGTNLNLALAVDTAFDPLQDGLRVF
jgi:hypothetical protein